ncbi:hypothetical protein [Cytobacillus gottheilii]|uniref:hypothetical protein n=1 Tax=Cytobacillus gottheilii TaxID=859144 RepID=UPI0009BADEE8|nr:hypothetical protein [Cytobacillus gottheilii]
MFILFILVSLSLLIFTSIATLNLLGFLGVIVIIITLVIPIWYFFKKYNDIDLNNPSNYVIMFFGLIGLIILTILVAQIVFSITGIESKEIKREVEEDMQRNDYNSAIRSIENLEDVNHKEADKMEKVVIADWINYCIEENDSGCKEDFLKYYNDDYSAEYVAHEILGADGLQKWIDEVDIYKYDRATREIESKRDSPPYEGMDEKYISETSWGKYTEKKTSENNPRGNTYTYIWIKCESGTQISRYASVVDGKVLNVDESEVAVEDISPHMRSCLKN